MAAMTCNKTQTFLADAIFDSSHVPADVQQHLAECSVCQKELSELQATMQLLDAWKVPEPSPYFDTRLTARLREEKNSSQPGLLQRLIARLMLNGNLNVRSVLAAAFALLLVVGVGSYEGFVHLNGTHYSRPAVSATVTDLELLDSDAQTLQELAAFDNSDIVVGHDSSSKTHN